jgi:stringent starvation protein B
LLFACEREQSPHKHDVPRIADARESTGPAKQRAVERMLAKGAVLVHLDARTRGVIVPPKYATDPDLVLRIGHGLSPPISDLEITQRGIAGTLKFDGALFHTVVPWTAIFGLKVETTDEVRVWDDEIPPELQHGSDAR